MKIEDLVREHKESILKKWFQHVVKTYPDETAKFLQREKDPFDNPVGSNILTGTEEIFDQLTSGDTMRAVTPFLERMIKIRAIQDFRPSQAVAFVLTLKGIIREELGGEIQKKDILPQMLAFEDRIDSLALLVFDAYMESREKVYALRAQEAKARVAGLLKRAGLLQELEDDSDN